MIDWRAYSPARLLRRNASIFIDAVHKSIQTTVDRAEVAAESYHPNSAPDDALPLLAADAYLPTYGGESPDRIAARLLQRNTILNEAGTLPCIARIVSLYFPTSARVLVVSRPGYYAQRVGGVTSTGLLGFALDWDSVAFPTLPSDRANDTFVFVEGPFDFTFRADFVLQSGATVLQPTKTVSLAFSDPSGRDVFRALRTALREYTSVWTTVRELVLVDPSQPSNTYFNIATSGTFPAGQYGRLTTRPAVHRYTGELT